MLSLKMLKNWIDDVANEASAFRSNTHQRLTTNDQRVATIGAEAARVGGQLERLAKIQDVIDTRLNVAEKNHRDIMMAMQTSPLNAFASRLTEIENRYREDRNKLEARVKSGETTLATIFERLRKIEAIMLNESEHTSKLTTHVNSRFSAIATKFQLLNARIPPGLGTFGYGGCSEGGRGGLAPIKQFTSKFRILGEKVRVPTKLEREECRSGPADKLHQLIIEIDGRTHYSSVFGNATTCTLDQMREANVRAFQYRAQQQQLPFYATLDWDALRIAAVDHPVWKEGK